MIQQTSILAYKNFIPKVNRLQKQVLQALTLGNATNLEIATIIDKRINIVTPRMNELFKKGLVRQVGKRSCKISHKLAIEWSIKR